jgi:hypothetical protein
MIKISNILNDDMPDVVVHTCNPSTEEDEAGGLSTQGQPGLHRQALS